MSEPKVSSHSQTDGDVSAMPSYRDALVGLVLELADFIYSESHKRDDTYYSEQEVLALATIRSLASVVRYRRLHGEKQRGE